MLKGFVLICLVELRKQMGRASIQAIRLWSQEGKFYQDLVNHQGNNSQGKLAQQGQI